MVVNEVCFDKGPISLIRMKNQQNQSVTERYRGRKCGARDKNVEWLCCHEVEAMGYFELLGMRYGDMDAVTQRV